ncbi:MAG: hypothetical protein QNK37_26230 [Acidobacteriota bacterium]|nr:hypothetical protein [Acidobacteriota bacterium]
MKLKELCYSRTGMEGHWRLPAIAAGLPEAVEKGLEAVAPQELAKAVRSEVTLGPSKVYEHTLALTVSVPDAVMKIYQEVKDLKDVNPWYEYFIYVAERYFFRPVVDDTAEPWRWYDFLESNPFDKGCMDLRPIENATLTLADLMKAMEIDPYLLRGLQYQDIHIEASVFDYFLDKLTDIDPYVAALMVELSRRSGFDQNLWIDPVSELYRQAAHADEVIPLIYAVLNRKWSVTA